MQNPWGVKSICLLDSQLSSKGVDHNYDKYETIYLNMKLPLIKFKLETKLVFQFGISLEHELLLDSGPSSLSSKSVHGNETLKNKVIIILMFT